MSNDLFKDINLKYHLNGQPKETPLAVCFEQVSKKFSLQRENVRSLQELFIGLLQHQYRRVKEKQEWFWVLKDINFEIRAGETVGFIGINGAGKSTLLKLVSQVLYPTQGRIEVNGKIGALLEVGTGFHPDMTGRENIYLNGSILGLSRTDIDQKLDQIIDFAEIGKFIDVPVKHYSSGMYLRLGFSVIINTDPDILLIDEILSVGDASFQRKCMAQIYKLKERGTTILFVSHSPGSVEQLCQRAIWLDQGKIVADGEAYDVIMDYSRHFYELERKQVEQALYQETDVEEEADFVLNETPEITEVDSGFVKDYSDEGEDKDGTEEKIESEVSETVEESLQQWGTGDVLIEQVHLLNEQGQKTSYFSTGESMTIEMHYQAKQPVENPVFGLAIHRNDGVHVAGPNTKFSGQQLPFIEGIGIVRYTLPALWLLENTYYLSVAVTDWSTTNLFDYHDRMYPFHIMPDQSGERYGLVSLNGNWDFDTGSKNKDILATIVDKTFDDEEPEMTQTVLTPEEI